ncbi:putative adenylyltransferase/sulfurtransferase MoeZ [Lacunisphaera limnophila]|uniref:Putative adenylyltransferase/sulfurtransferase MoeZ n=1 Tax=Lacunisphaera limnophila TaxID=1838286 RepID=A0A1D8AX97_9BACT|nr:rhodanese-like domain-containing protein [Lacunisphaera limnophila]AOS45525.1 putative adenylyltransferase/sulfurtransferase MoeZ [Lacunisphaera limnophila]
MDTPLEIDVTTAARLQAEGALLLDVREASEVATCAIPGSQHLPMGQVPAALAALPKDRLILVQCHHGGRSLRVTQFLRANGFTQVTNVAGGIDAWAREIDPTLARY